MKRIIILAILLSQAIFGTAAYGHETEEAQNALQMCTECNGTGKTHCPICTRSNYHNPGKCEVCKGKGYVN